jgi:predicted nucleic acid-binding protein
MIVADANLLAYLVIPGERTEEAAAVLQHDPFWVMPPLWQCEIRSVLLKYLRVGVLTSSQAIAVWERALKVVEGREAEPSTNQVLAMAQQSGRSSYDCEYVALASHLGVPLVTADRSLAKAFPDLVLSPEMFISR